MSAEPFSQPLTRERRVAPRGSLLPGLLAALALTVAAGVLVSLYGPTYAGDPSEVTRPAAGGWSHVLGYALAIAAAAGAGLQLWATAARRKPVDGVAAAALAATAFLAVGGGMLFLPGTLHLHYATVPLDKAYRYYAWALEKDYGEYRGLAAQGQADVAIWRSGRDEGRKRIQGAREAAAKYRALDEQRIREARWFITHGGLFGPARTEALARFDQTFADVRRMQKARWAWQDAKFAGNAEFLEVLAAPPGQMDARIRAWNDKVPGINGLFNDETKTLCQVSERVVGKCVLTDDKRPQRPD